MRQYTEERGGFAAYVAFVSFMWGCGVGEGRFAQLLLLLLLLGCLVLGRFKGFGWDLDGMFVIPKVGR